MGKTNRSASRRPHCLLVTSTRPVLLYRHRLYATKVNVSKIGRTVRLAEGTAVGKLLS